MAEEPCVVTIASGEAEANLIRSVLAAHGIESMFATRIAQSVYPISVDGLGEIKVMVRAEDEERARQIIADYQKESG